MLLGGTLGLLAGYYRGRLETAIMGVTDVMLSFPAIILALTFVTFLGRDLHWIVLAIGILAVPPIARIARANTLAYAQREFVLAARALGARDRRVLAREVLPNVVIPMASFALIVVAIAVVAEGTLAFLGLSVEAPTPTWGGMIVEGKDMLLVKDPAPHVALVPSIAMFLTVLAFNLAGDKLRAFFDVKEGAL
ncbi:MAG: ABC transporter permease [Acidimicrobiia bacterium]|nr:ABC transporter permease [Acidimicrobiia bacterium]